MNPLSRRKFLRENALCFSVLVFLFSTEGAEVVWFNFAPGRTHGVGHAGRNATDRQRIKRKATRWAEGYRKMPPAERQAVMAALMAVEAS